jgi:DnaJ-class molecular chaperone
MGFDVFGKKPTNKVGEYFYNNIWEWRPLWDYVFRNLEVLPEEDYKEGHYNNGYEINNEKARNIAIRLKQKIKNGKTEEYIAAYNKLLDELPAKPCVSCDGSGLLNLPDSNDVVNCNVCNGTGKAISFIKSYPMDIENMKDFAEFCKNSGGLEIY